MYICPYIYIYIYHIYISYHLSFPPWRYVDDGTFFSCLCFLLLHLFHIPFFPFSTLLMYHYFFHFSSCFTFIFQRFHFALFLCELSSCCILFMLHFFCIAHFSSSAIYCNRFLLLSFHCALLYCPIFMCLFCITLFLCCFFIYTYDLLSVMD